MREKIKLLIKEFREKEMADPTDLIINFEDLAELIDEVDLYPTEPLDWYMDMRVRPLNDVKTHVI